jgi:hypothetical protein
VSNLDRIVFSPEVIVLFVVVLILLVTIIGLIRMIFMKRR